jgi:dolichyl-phosphate beta-glucosyltransferase
VVGAKNYLRRYSPLHSFGINKLSEKYPVAISIIIPCWNEQKNLEQGVLNEIKGYLNNQSYTWEVIIVDDGSSDQSKQIIEGFKQNNSGFTLIEIPHSGKLTAIWTGICSANGEILLFTDMDQSTPIEESKKLLPFYDLGFDVVIGSRGVHRYGTSLVRKTGSVFFRFIRQMIILRHISDTQCGFKSFRRDAALRVFPKLICKKKPGNPTGWKVSAFDVELLFLLELHGYTVKEVNVQWENRDISDTKDLGKSRNSYLRESYQMVLEVLSIKWNQVTGQYDQK